MKGESDNTALADRPNSRASRLLATLRISEIFHSLQGETSGAIDVSAVDARFSKILDIKTPDSGEAATNLWGEQPGR